MRAQWVWFGEIAREPLTPLHCKGTEGNLSTYIPTHLAPNTITNIDLISFLNLATCYSLLNPNLKLQLSLISSPLQWRTKEFYWGWATPSLTYPPSSTTSSCKSTSLSLNPLLLFFCSILRSMKLLLALQLFDLLLSLSFSSSTTQFQLMF